LAKLPKVTEGMGTVLDTALVGSKPTDRTK
jgi:hypothetical protein